MLINNIVKDATAAFPDRIYAGFIALLLGVFFIFGAGFANSDVIHNAAHDTRHALAFPCH